jgi:pimeloyl-ACP methyl ester carboxylesterase
MGLLLGVTFVGFVVVCLGGFISWRRRVLTRVLRGGEIAETVKGPVEFGMVGTGPVIRHLHGGASGYDQTLALSWDLHEAGFPVLSPSRPGYLRTPLTTGASPEQAADVLAGLLDVLSIDKVCVMGTSGGGPTALQFALRNPARVWGSCFKRPSANATSSRAAPPTPSSGGSSSPSRGRGWLTSWHGGCICSRDAGPLY